jgi:hypothetical protein
MLSLIPVATPDEDNLESLSGLVRLLSDPKAADRIAEFKNAAKVAATAVAEAQEIQAQAQADRDKLASDLAEKKAAHDKQIRSDRFDFAQEMSAARSNVAVRELAVDRAETYLKSRTAEVEQMHKDLTGRLDALKRATSAAST